jgi:hypothetical protein
MVTVETTADELIVRPQGWHRFLAFAGEIRVPLAHVVAVASAAQEARGWFHGIRAPGTSIPGVVTAGTFYDSEGRAFWDVSEASRAIAIRLRDDHYVKLVVEVQDVEATLAFINSALSGLVLPGSSLPEA